MGQFGKQDWTTLDKIYLILYLKKHTASMSIWLIYMSKATGRQTSAPKTDIALFDGAFKLIISKDSIIADMAWTDLVQCASFRYRDVDDISAVRSFLNNDPSNFTNRGAS